MARLSYVGRDPTSDSVLVPKTYADSTAAATLVTSDEVTAAVTTQITLNTLEPQSYVNTQDGLRAHKSAVDAADATYLATSALNAANGVPGLDSSGGVLLSQIPSGVTTDRVAKVYNAATDGTLHLGPTDTLTVTTENMRESSLATITVPDPGYPWLPLPFAVVQGACRSGDQPPDHMTGMQVSGLLAVMAPVGVSDRVFGSGLCTPSYTYEYYYCIPYGGSNYTPVNNPPLTGSLQLDFYASCFAGSGYSFYGAAAVFWILVMPAIGL